MASQGDVQVRRERYIGNIIRIFAVLFLSLLGASICKAETVEEMVSNCHSVVNAPVSNDQVMIREDRASGICWGAFLVFQQMIMIVDYPSDKHPLHPFFKVCAPEESTRTQLIAVFYEYAKKHPERYHEDFFFVALDAERAAFPCK